MTLTGRAVTLREFRPDDAAPSLSVVGDDQVTRWLSFDSRDQAAAESMIDGAVTRAKAGTGYQHPLAQVTAS